MIQNTKKQLPHAQKQFDEVSICIKQQKLMRVREALCNLKTQFCSGRSHQIKKEEQGNRKSFLAKLQR